VPVVESSADELAGAIDDIDDAPRRNPVRRLFDHLLEDPMDDSTGVRFSSGSAGDHET